MQAHDPLAIQPWLVAARIDQSAQEGTILLAAALDADELRQHHPQLYTQDDTLHWDAARQVVRALRSERLGALTLSSQPWNPPAEQVRTALLAAIRAQPELLPWNDAARQWQARLMSLRIWLGTSWPCVADATLLSQLASWLAPYLDGLSRGSELQRLPLNNILATLLDYPSQQRLAQLAPPQLTVPSGSHLTLGYHPEGSPPILAVRLQELFGLQQTPKVAGGKVSVVLHLLSPGHRPIQVTQDLASFWHNTYPEVKQELQRRYPRHYWPDDPLQAQATARPRPRPPR
jgi:ATP-dependent helicase HrpB